MTRRPHFRRLDLISLLVYLILISISLIMIYSISYSLYEPNEIFTLGSQFFKQLIFVSGSLVLGFFIYLLKIKFLLNSTDVFYMISIGLLLGLFVFGDRIAGAQSWYSIGTFGFQPSELAKVTTVLMISKLFHRNDGDALIFRNFLLVLGIIFLPMILIVSQSDPGTTVTFLFLSFLLYRQGISVVVFMAGILVFFIFMITLIFGTVKSILILFLFVYSLYFLIKRFNLGLTKRILTLVTCCSLVVILFSGFVYYQIFEPHHRDRIEVFLGLETDIQNIGYQLNQSKIALESGRLFGTGYLNGPRTLGNYIPEQHTDYIFTAVAEQWGFAGSILIIGLYILLIIRVLNRASLHNSQFRKTFSYGFAAFLLGHFLINIGSNIGLVPTIGIPLPFLSYGGSNILSFTIFMAIYLSMDYRRLSHKTLNDYPA